MLEGMKASLPLVPSEVMESVTMTIPSSPVGELATAILSAIENIVYHDLWAAFLVIHPGLSGCNFYHRAFAMT